MSDALERVRSRYKEIERQRIYVEEWDLEIWFSPYTIVDDREIRQVTISATQDGSSESFGHVVLRKAEDKDGKRLFEAHEIIEFIRLGEATLVKAIAVQIMASQGDASTPGKSEKIPS